MAYAATASVEQYNYDIVRKFTFMAIVWGVVGMAAANYRQVRQPVKRAASFGQGGRRSGRFLLA